MRFASAKRCTPSRAFRSRFQLARPCSFPDNHEVRLHIRKGLHASVVSQTARPCSFTNKVRAQLGWLSHWKETMVYRNDVHLFTFRRPARSSPSLPENKHTLLLYSLETSDTLTVCEPCQDCWVLMASVVLECSSSVPRLRILMCNDPFILLDYMVYQLEYDSVHGRFNGTIAMSEEDCVSTLLKVWCERVVTLVEIVWDVRGLRVARY